jgi:hypothetical protein
VKTAHAQAATPWGGRILFPFYCTCSFNFLLFITPLPPTYPVMLLYTPATQMFLSYNLPYTTNALGWYSNSGGSCQIYYVYGCLTIFTGPTITPVVGSSPL